MSKIMLGQYIRQDKTRQDKKRHWASQMRMVHLYWLDTATPYYNGNCLEGPEKHILLPCNAGKLRPALQGMQKRGPEECIGNYSPQLVVRGCGYWFWHYVGSITQRQA